MAKYFSAYRIDHVLGFFRIWEMPDHAVTGLMGRFRPSIPLSTVSSHLLCEELGLCLILWSSSNKFKSNIWLIDLVSTGGTGKRRNLGFWPVEHPLCSLPPSPREIRRQMGGNCWQVFRWIWTSLLSVQGPIQHWEEDCCSNYTRRCCSCSETRSRVRSSQAVWSPSCMFLICKLQFLILWINLSITLQICIWDLLVPVKLPLTSQEVG